MRFRGGLRRPCCFIILVCVETVCPGPFDTLEELTCAHNSVPALLATPFISVPALLTNCTNENIWEKCKNDPTLVQRLVAIPLDLGEVHEDVLAALVGSDEAEALLTVEKLHGTGLRHDV